MTNEHFMKMTEYALENKESAVRYYYEHAKKLVVVAEAAAYMYDRIYLDSDEENYIVEADNMIKVREALENLERE